MVEEYRGHVVELRGDEALVVFGSPRSAIRAAVALQQRFVDESIADPWAPAHRWDRARRRRGGSGPGGLPRRRSERRGTTSGTLHGLEKCSRAGRSSISP